MFSTMTIIFIVLVVIFMPLILYLRKKRFQKAAGISVLIFGAFLLICLPLVHSQTRFQIVSMDKSSPPAEDFRLYEGSSYDGEIIKIKDQVLIDAPVIKQLPELPRGCEVTSLAMLLQHANIQVDKMTLAEQIKKDPAPYREENGKIYFGNPHDGFVGNMYSRSEPGLGVYHGPVAELAERYLPGRILDLTGRAFEELKIHLSDHRPVWVIVNTTYKKLPESQFETWHTPSGTIKITYKEHAVLMTGYDEDYVYFNDPLTGEKNRKLELAGFREAWEQMGRQAITYVHP